MTKLTLTFLLFATLFSREGHAQKKQLTTAQKEDKIRDIIAKLPEVIDADNYVIKASKGSRHLETYIDGTPGRDEKYYIVTVGEFNGMNMVPHLKFAVYIKTYAIYYWDYWDDASDNQFIPLAKWQKQLATKKRNKHNN